MLPLFRRNVGRALKIQLHHCNPAYQLLPEKPSQNPSEPSKTPLVGSSFGSLPLNDPETSHHQDDPKDVDHKFSVIDRKTVITGSFNWSPSAAHQNDEVLLVIRSAQVAAHFSREMDRLWRNADLGITERLRRKLERNRQRCGSGIQRD